MAPHSECSRWQLPFCASHAFGPEHNQEPARLPCTAARPARAPAQIGTTSREKRERRNRAIAVSIAKFALRCSGKPVDEVDEAAEADAAAEAKSEGRLTRPPSRSTSRGNLAAPTEEVCL